MDTEIFGWRDRRITDEEQLFLNLCDTEDELDSGLLHLLLEDMKQKVAELEEQLHPDGFVLS